MFTPSGAEGLRPILAYPSGRTTILSFRAKRSVILRALCVRWVAQRGISLRLIALLRLKYLLSHDHLLHPSPRARWRQNLSALFAQKQSSRERFRAPRRSERVADKISRFASGHSCHSRLSFHRLRNSSSQKKAQGYSLGPR